MTKPEKPYDIRIIFELDLFVDLTEAQINNAKINNFVSFLFLVIIGKSNIKEKYLFHKL